MDAILNDIRDNLGFTIISSEPIPGGFMNTLIKLVCDTGTYLLKIYSRVRFSDKKLQKIEDALSIQRQLKSRGVKTAAIIPIEGKNVRILPCGSAYSLMSFISGRNETYETINKRQLQSLGSELSLIHREMEKLTEKYMLLPDNSASIINSLWDNYKKRCEGFTPDMPKDYIETVKNQKVVLETLSPNRIQKLKRQLCHEDFTFDNILFDGDHVGAVIDFDRTQVSYPLHDVGRALLSFALKDNELLPDRIEAFKKGYNEQLPLTDNDIKDAFMITWCIETLWWITPEFFMGTRGKADRFRKEIMWLTFNLDKI
ncbi:MAG: phosphotransferase [Clostridia bacterium]|nr:phosphotransferase [Clostridia bacterium]